MTQGNAGASGSIGVGVDIMFDKSEYNLLNSPYGFTNNSLATPDPFGHSHETGKKLNLFNLSSKVFELTLSKDPLNFFLSGPYNGIVLRIDSVDVSKQNSEESDLERILEGTDGQTSMFVMRVRIPELHTHIPMPKTVVGSSYEKSDFENLSDTAAPCKNRIKIDSRIVDMYPKFTGYIKEGTPSIMPQVGSYVRVDFSNRISQEGGFYIGPLTDKAMITTTKIYDMAYGSFNPKLDPAKEEEPNITVQPSGQFNSPVPTEDSQVAKPKPIGKPKNPSTQVPLGDWDEVL